MKANDHLVFEELYKHMPRKRFLPNNVNENVKQAISLKQNSKLLQQKIENSGINFTLKGIANKKEYGKSDFKE